MLASIALVTVLAACGGGDDAAFDEAAVKDAIASSGKFDTDADAASALQTFRNVCATPDESINQFSVHDILTKPDDYPAEFVATAKLGCRAKFARVQTKIDNGDCFGGPLAGCN